ncbi:type II toxin-antitoxin system RelE/ParE family toxin [Enterobacter roggenkampii]|uniref:type II toxin-antitoxin system RelE/ParE family toxin n=1 Tax=Enterobacter roggenkampii TaxID=1812935 RepID=UPI0032AEEBFE
MAKVKHYITADGYDPFDAYLRSVKDPIAKAMIATRVARMSTGNYGDCKPCRESVSELRINQGPGYRVYFSEVSDPADGAVGNDSNLLIVFYVQIMPDDFVMQLHRF